VADLLTRIPPFGNASNPRMLFLAQVAVPVVAALLWRAAPRPGASAVARPALATFLLAGVVSGTAALAWLAIDERWALRPWVGLASAATLLAADRIAATAATRRLVAVAIPIMLLIDVGAVYIGYHPQVPRQWANPLRVRNILPPQIFEDPHPRLALDASAAQNLSALYGVVDIRGYGYPVPVRYDAYMREGLGLANPATLEPQDLGRSEVIAGIERTCARWLLTTREYGAEWASRVELVWSHKRLHLYELPRAVTCAAWHAREEVSHVPDLARAVVSLRDGLLREPEPIVVELAGREESAPHAARAGRSATIERPQMGRIEAGLPAPTASDGWIVIRESFDPGWRATSESGESLIVAPAQVRFLAVEVPAGTQRVTLRYVPPLWGTAWALAGVSFAGLALTAVRGIRHGGTRFTSAPDCRCA
jgi:hypothetical protein